MKASPESFDKIRTGPVERKGGNDSPLHGSSEIGSSGTLGKRALRGGGGEHLQEI
jgi:hypothetical protein